MIRGKSSYPGFAGRLSGWSSSHSGLSSSDTHHGVGGGGGVGAAGGGGGRISESETCPLRRDSYEVQSDSDSSHQPHRPW